MKINEQRKNEVVLEEEERLRNRKFIHVLLDCCRYLCRQCLGFRGSKDEFEGNFNQVVHFLARWIPIMDYWFSSTHLRPYNVTYLSKNSQNEYINLIGDEIRKLIAEEIASAKFFAVVVDTTLDKSHRNKISLVIRYVNERFNIKERLIKISER